MRRTLFTLLLLLFCCSMSAQVALVKDGKAVGRIVCQNTDAQTKAAATLLQDFVERISGAKMSVVASPQKKLNPGDVVIGTPTDKATEDGFEITEDRNVLYVNTGGGSGAVNGVVWLLEHELGVHYYAKDYYVIDPRPASAPSPKKKKSAGPGGVDLVVSAFPVHGEGQTVASSPAFRYRQTHSYGCEDPTYRQWFALEEPKDEFIAGMWVHTFNRILPASRFGKEHPEWYSYLNGERRPGDHSQWCLSNPEVLEACAQQLDSIFKANPR